MQDRLITSRQNSRIKQAIALRQRSERNNAGLMLVEGKRELIRAANRGIAFVEVFVAETRLHDIEIVDLCTRLELAGAEVWHVGEIAFEKLAFGDRQEGIVGTAKIPPATLDKLPKRESPLVAVFEGIEKPGNLGAALRSADGAGIDAVVACGKGVDLWSPNVIRASLGAVFSMPVASASPDDVAAWLCRSKFTLYAARPDATLLYTDADFRGPTALLLGSEAAGLTSKWAGADIVPIRLPMHGIGDSLNVSVAAAILFYEARRQRGAK